MATTKYVVKPGDTLNSIAKKAGYSDYKSAGINNVPSGDFNLIRPGEEITMNGSSNQVSTFKETPAVVTSQDLSTQFKSDSDKLDSVINAPKLEDKPGKDIVDDPNTDFVETGDKTYDLFQKSASDAKNKAKLEGAEVTKEYDKLYGIELAAIDARTKATVNSLKSTFEQRIKEQERINKVNVDRVKAYGLGGGQAMYTPIEWSDAITEREREGANEIKGLERERQSLIDQAKAAKEEGNAKLLSQKMTDYNNAKEKLNKRLAEIETESAKQYETLTKIRKERETEFKEKQTEALKRLQSYYKLNKDEVENLSDDEKEALVNKLSTKYGFEPYEVLSLIEEAVLPDYDIMKSEAEIEKIKASTNASNASAESSRASAASSWAMAAKRKKETEKLDDPDTEEDKTYSQTEKNKLREAGLDDAPQEVKDGYLYGDGEFDDAVVKYQGGDTGGSDTIDENDPEGLGI
jgi:LysM repeat protein